MSILKFVKRNLERFQNDRRAIAPIWIIAGCTLAFTPILYWSLSIALDTVALNVLATVPLVGNQLVAWTIVKTLVSLIPIVILFTTILWSYINAKASVNE
jgi:hypothetical protein